MAIKALLISLFALTLAGTAQAQSYICVEEKVTGFSVENGEWVITRFRDGGKWLVSLDEGGKATRFGESYSEYSGEFCSAGPTWLRCSNAFGHFAMSPGRLRFSRSYIVGYIDGADNDDNTPALAIGTCAKL